MKPLDDVVEFALSVGLDVFDGTERTPPEIERARISCDQLLAAPLELDDATIWKLLVASATLVADDGVAFLVHELAAGHADAECPHCDRSSSLVTDGTKIWLASNEAGPGDAGTRESSMQLPDELGRLVARARTAGRPAIVNALELLGSRAQCPFCHEWSRALETVVALRD